MRKEMVVAILFGLIVGLFLTYGFYRARLAITQGNNPVATPTPGTLTSPSPNANSQITIISPEDETVQAEKSVTITGKTITNATIVILVNNEEDITMSDGTGNFSQARQLESGSNVIIVTVLDPNGATITAERTVIVANTEALSPSQSATPSATPAGQSTR